MEQSAKISRSPLVSTRNLFNLIGGFPRQLMRVNLLRFIWSAARWFLYAIILRRMRTLDTVGDGVSKNTISHNMRSILDLSVNRSLRLILPLVAIENIRRNIEKKKILSIGPRTEGEYWNLVSWGFRRKNISAVDLISYSPLIQLADMHRLPFGDSEFDVVIAGWVLAYSDKKDVAAAEIIRVLRPGGLVALGVEWRARSVEETSEKLGYTAGSTEFIHNRDDLLRHFSGHVDHVYFDHDESGGAEAQMGDILVIFRCKK